MLFETISVSTKILKAVYEGANLDTALDPYRNSSDAPHIFELCYGTLRHWYSIKEHIDILLVKRLKKQNNDVQCLLLIGAYQLHNTKIPPYAVVSESVKAVRHIGKDWAAGLVNAVLKKAIRLDNPSHPIAHDEIELRARLAVTAARLSISFPRALFFATHVGVSRQQMGSRHPGSWIL